MWISKQITGASLNESALAGRGEVTISHGAVGVYTDAERRDVPSVTPGGYTWRPRQGQRVLVIKTDEGESVIAGLLQEPDENQDGDIIIETDSARIKISKIDGTVTLGGKVYITGDLYVKGEKYRPCTCFM